MALLPKKKSSKDSSKNSSSTTTFLGLETWLYSLYITIICFISVIVIAVTTGIIMTTLGNKLFISDDEYIASDRAYEIRACSEPQWIKDDPEQRTSEEIESCEEDARESSIASRHVNFKETLINAISVLIVFSILLAIHYPKFLKNRKKG